MSTCDISKHERSISIFEHFMTKFHELPEQPSYLFLNSSPVSKCCIYEIFVFMFGSKQFACEQMLHRNSGLRFVSIIQPIQIHFQLCHDKMFVQKSFPIKTAKIGRNGTKTVIKGIVKTQTCVLIRQIICFIHKLFLYLSNTTEIMVIIRVNENSFFVQMTL